MKKTNDGWTWNKDGGGTAGTYTKDGWTVWCNGTQWFAQRPDGYGYAKGFANIGPAKDFAEKKMAAGDSRKEYMRIYGASNYDQVKFQLRKDDPEDQQILAHIKSQRNVTEYIRELVRKDMKK